MTQLQIQISNQQYQYLQQRVAREKTTLEKVLFDMIQADMAWRQQLKTDPITALIGKINDSFDTDQIDEVVYQSA